MAALRAPDDKTPMQGMGEKLRARARQLGWSDAEVARRVGLAQTRYANYVGDKHEPDLATLRRICAVLGISPVELLGTEVPASNGVEALRGRISAAMLALDERSLDVTAMVVDGLVARLAPAGAVEPRGGEPSQGRPRGRARRRPPAD